MTTPLHSNPTPGRPNALLALAQRLWARLVLRLGVRRAAAVVLLGALVLVAAVRHQQEQARVRANLASIDSLARLNAYITGMGAQANQFTRLSHQGVDCGGSCVGK